MAKVVTMPKLGLTMTEGKLTKWYKAEGEEIQAGEVFFDVTTDKLTNEVEATESGIVRKLLVKEEDVVECLKPVAIIAAADEDISSLIAASGSTGDEAIDIETSDENTEKASVDKPKEGRRIKASPVAKKLAEENNIDLELVTGTGPNGRITLEDVENYINSAAKKVKASPMAEKTAAALDVDLCEIKKDSRIMKEDVYNYLKDKDVQGQTNLIETRIPMSQMRKIIASRMFDSWRVSPAVTFDIKVDVTRLKEIRNWLKSTCKVTFTDLLVKIIATTLLEFPYLNSRIENDEIVTRNYANIGVAVALEGGLVVPVVKYANTKGLKQISSEVKELAEKARNNELSQEDLTEGTFTITNLGMYGIESFSPIINQPEVAILGVNTITDTSVVVNGEIVIKPLMNLSLTADHRVVDGAVAAQFLSRVKEYIEKPEMLLL
ncbi:dihydrolipoamide acetyltransferase family protein [Clostridium formicaceticum]|uniref:Dihydrolipoamide acetyltransferase component of pyruvate dehydrogenase complex n=1 Tax=Clostridium formicaceticum TaxID=1497 RepID=A0AAC9RJE2_9CLOT|nr:dihydrolipoamide acetyltransferase family protein [Clostridium formicaceticum]AOY75859.1 PdhC [Clostridium formicaceticum]ARE86198.1 Dihydrolipoyllysine-residue acetyltransferase component of pyruvate dehydrogenase complex [Clostridium formicaceticum]